MFGYMWICLVMCGYAWLCVDMFGYMWICLVICGYAWLCVDMLGYMWICLVMCGYAWLCVDMRRNGLTSALKLEHFEGSNYSPHLQQLLRKFLHLLWGRRGGRKRKKMMLMILYWLKSAWKNDNEFIVSCLKVNLDLMKIKKLLFYFFVDIFYFCL